MRVIVGAERLSQYDGLLRGKRIGLITNFSGISPDWSQDTIHLLVDAGYDLVKIFTPEHGLYGAEAESRRLLDLMINSIYTHKQIFLREIISNASGVKVMERCEALLIAGVSIEDPTGYTDLLFSLWE